VATRGRPVHHTSTGLTTTSGCVEYWQWLIVILPEGAWPGAAGFQAVGGGVVNQTTPPAGLTTTSRSVVTPAMANSNATKYRLAWGCWFPSGPRRQGAVNHLRGPNHTSTVGTDDGCGQYYTETNGAGFVHPAPHTKNRFSWGAWFRQLETLQKAETEDGPPGEGVHPRTPLYSPVSTLAIFEKRG